MSDPGPGRTAPAPRAQEEESTLRKVISVLQQVLLIYAVTQFAGHFFGSKTSSTQPSPVIPGNSPDPVQVDQVLLSAQSAKAHLAWPLGVPVSLYFHLSTDPTGQVFAGHPKETGLPHFVWNDITFGNWSETRTVDYNVHLPETVQRNGSLWAHIFLTKDNADPDPSSPKYRQDSVHHVSKLLTRYLPKSKIRKERNLLQDKAKEADGQEEPEVPDMIVSYWHQNLTLALVSDATVLQYAQLPPPIAEHVHLVPGLRDETGTNGYYNPIIFPNEFWHLKSQYVEINDTTTTLPLQVVFQPMSYFKFQLFASMTFGFQEAVKQQGSGSSAEIDEVKRMLIETNPWFLGLTGIVSVLHVVFEMLAFKSDVSHWRKKDELTGVSVRTIVTNVFVQLVILLYLIDNNTDTSWMILMGSGMGLLIEAWKITKAVDIKLVASEPGSVLPWKVVFADKHVLSEDEKKTQEYDKLAFRYVSYVALPALAIYAVYSLVYDTHRGWYSFVISTLTSFVYMFGFAQLVPQLIINYKLKSVAHMPMKAMVYKTLSTVIDDLFAFIIKMPILHRLACFRDDVVFLIFLYQRWIYRIDPKRINEYGQVMVEEEESKKDK
ncbi:cleft lip and palate associated transmembrane protein [Lactarius akahatsu]|uniref:Cleft lip and palate associated transmembrane protein n=1 Tax=Lactarius akahatsu TaxID=416441 RepID=A0AAD4LQR9_9AGAM|nr:cleft lip and palate associated transmembrane protein [Lactarius akahatsu]